MKHLYPLALLLLVVVLPARADVLWYNGDFDNLGDLVSVISPIDGTFLVFDDFIVPSGGWTVNGLWSTDTTLGTWSGSSVYWEIRSGMSAGDGGTLVASGTSPGSETYVGLTAWGLDVNTFSVTGLSVPLGEGTYWLAVAPVSPDSALSTYVLTTSGANAVGTPAGNNDNSFFYAPDDGIFYQPTGLFGERPVNDFSMGIEGTSQGQIPEPCTFALFGLGALGLLRARKRRR